MVDKESRPVFQLSASLGCNWKNIERSHEQTEKAKADLLTLLQREVGEKFASEDANLVVFGSLGRAEWIDWLSDLDWTFLVDGQCKPHHFWIAQGIRDALRTEQRQSKDGKLEFRFAEPGPTGTFGNMGFSHQLIHLIGGQEDTNKNTTQRILLLLESLPISEPNAHQRVLKAIIQRYLEEEPHLIAKDRTRFKVPRFLLNDIVRFWRTMAVDFASKQRDRGGEGWGLRNAKLRMSRKLIFVSGLVACFSCSLDERLRTKISTDERDTKTARSLNLAHLQDHILQYVKNTPLDIVALAAMEYGIDASIARSLFSTYDDFLGLMNDREKREHLKKLRAEASRKDPVFGQIRDCSERFSEALRLIFFEHPKLSVLTQKYGVF
ncbi:MAG: nucleotidyltransferase domain-containing protein [Acidobacteriia bacterium]|nr:nucleotidyltransferase domain-containing protein [Terriglobia bacterium]